jgi:ribosomal protein S18 acetylase RimI-like enzyme
MTGSQPRTAEVRRVRAADWAALRAARLAALAEAPYAFGSTVAREQQFTEATWRDRTRTGAIFAAWSGTEIVGLATARLDPEEGGWALFGMWVHPHWRATGVAARLLDAACETAHAAGAGEITLWVTEVNGRAGAFYARHGFTPTGGRQLVRPEQPDHWEVQLARTLDRAR